MFVVSEELGADPHVAELGHKKTVALAREVELAPALALLLEEHRAVHVDKHNEEAQREVRNGLVDAIDLLNLVVHVLEDLLVGVALRAELYEVLSSSAYAKGLNLETVVDTHDQLYLALERKPDRKPLSGALAHLNLVIELLQPFEVLFEGVSFVAITALTTHIEIPVSQSAASLESQVGSEAVQEVDSFVVTVLTWRASTLHRQILLA